MHGIRISASEMLRVSQFTLTQSYSEYGGPANLSLVIAFKHPGRGFRAQIVSDQFYVQYQYRADIVKTRLIFS